MKQKSMMILTLTIVMLMAFTFSALGGDFKGKHRRDGMKHGNMKHGNMKHFGMGHEGMGLKFLKALNLSDDQKKMTAEIIGIYKDAIKTNLENMMTSRETMADTIFNKSQDEEAVRQAFQNTAKHREELVVIRAKILTELKNKVFTQEQVQKLETLRADKKEKMKKRFENKMSRIEDWLETQSDNL